MKNLSASLAAREPALHQPPGHRGVVLRTWLRNPRCPMAHRDETVGFQPSPLRHMNETIPKFWPFSPPTPMSHRGNLFGHFRHTDAGTGTSCKGSGLGLGIGPGENR